MKADGDGRTFYFMFRALGVLYIGTLGFSSAKFCICLDFHLLRLSSAGIITC